MQSLKTALEEQGNLIAGMRGHVGLQLDDVERQLVQIQELLGQGQIALLGLRERIQRREAERRSSPPVIREDTTERPRAAGTDPEALYNAAIEQLRRGDLQGRSDLLQHQHGRVPHTPFDAADIGPMQARFKGELLLRQPVVLPQPF